MSRLKKIFDNDNYRSGLRVVIICTLAVILVVGINLLSGLIPTKIGNMDISTEKVYSISKESESELKSLKKPVTIYYVCEEGQEYHNTEVMLNLYADSSKYITVEKIDPAYNPTLIAQYTDDTPLTNNSVIVVSGEKRQIIDYTDYYTSGVFVLEDFMNSAIKYVVSDEFKTVYSLIGHGETDIHSSTEAYMGLDGFSLKKLNLMEAGSVPKDANVVIINSINKDITEKEAELLLSYLESGGSLLLTTDYTTLSLKNLTKVTSYFGATMGEGLILEADTSRYTNENPAYILPTIYAGDYTITKGISYLLLPNTKPIIVDEKLEPSVVFTILLEASESSQAAYTNAFTGEVVSKEGPHTVGASFEKGEKAENGKMIWVTSKYISDVTVSESVGGGNITFFLNSVCWLGQDEPVESIHGKKISTKYLTFNESQLGLWSVVIIAIIPAIVLIVGLFICIRRRRR